MMCPKCVVETLEMADRMGIEIDYCPQCRGVWLDRGELDKIIERTVQYESPPSRAAGEGRHGIDYQKEGYYRGPDRRYEKHEKYRDKDYYKHKYKKKKHIIKEIFDIFD
jgi:Zn-finger nucleic acid-binding protein